MGLTLGPFWEYANTNSPFLKMFFATPPFRSDGLRNHVSLDSVGSRGLDFICCSCPAVTLMVQIAPWSREVNC